MWKSAIVILFLSFGQHQATAYACSCVRGHTIPEKVNDTPVIFEGTVVATQNLQLWKISKKTRFSVQKAFKGITSSEVSIGHEISTGGNCGVGFSKGEKVLVFAYKNENGDLETDSCAFHSNYSDLQFIKYFEEEFDSSDMDNFCSWEIAEAYKRAETSGKFELANESWAPRKSCEINIGTFNYLYRNGPKPDRVIDHSQSKP